jgi:hypothetical protein
VKRTFALLALLSSLTASAAPKYGPNAVPLSRQTNTEYFQKNPAPDYWTLAPFYLPQPTGVACSATNLTLVFNGARSRQELKSDDKLLTVADFAKSYADPAYAAVVLGTGRFDRSQVTSRNLARILREAGPKLGFKPPAFQVELVEVDYQDLAGSKRRFVEALKANEKSAQDYLILSAFMQGTLTGDPEGQAHVATVGAYDEKKGLVLIFDPDREWYEPYWSPVDKVWEAVSDKRADGKHSAWIQIRF